MAVGYIGGRVRAFPDLSELGRRFEDGRDPRGTQISWLSSARVFDGSALASVDFLGSWAWKSFSRSLMEMRSRAYIDQRGETWRGAIFILFRETLIENRSVNKRHRGRYFAMNWGSSAKGYNKVADFDGECKARERRVT